MKSMFSNKSVVPKQSGALATTNLAELGKTNRDEVCKKHLPRASLRILQDGSPEVKKQHAKYVEGAQSGMIYNTSTRQLYDGSEEAKKLVILICKYWPKWIEWLPGRKGFVAEHELGSEMALSTNLELRIEKDPNAPKEKKVWYSRITGNIMDETAIYHCLAFLDGANDVEEVAIDMRSSNWATAKLLNSHFQNAKIPDENGILQPAPNFTWAYQLFHKFRDEGTHSWYMWGWRALKRIDELSNRSQEYIQHAVEYRKLVEEGNLEFDYRREQAE